MTYTLIPDPARAYHSPQGVMAYIAHCHPGLLATIEELGPMRMHYDRDWGWMLNNFPVHFRFDKAGTASFWPTQTNRNGANRSSRNSRGQFFRHER